MVDRTELYRSPDVWGPKLWALLHACGAVAASEAALGPSWLDRVLHLLPPVLPCGACQRNLRSHLARRRRSDLDHIPDAVVWNMHETVNRAVGNPSGPDLATVLRSRPRRRRAYLSALRAALLCLARGWPERADVGTVRALRDLLDELLPVAGKRPPAMTTLRTRATFRKWAKSL